MELLTSMERLPPLRRVASFHGAASFYGEFLSTELPPSTELLPSTELAPSTEFLFPWSYLLLRSCLLLRIASLHRAAKTHGNSFRFMLSAYLMLTTPSGGGSDQLEARGDDAEEERTTGVKNVKDLEKLRNKYNNGDVIEIKEIIDDKKEIMATACRRILRTVHSNKYTGHKPANHTVLRPSEYIKSLDAEQDIALLKFHGWDLPAKCAHVLRISTILLKKGAEGGLSPFTIGNIMCRVTLKKESIIEEIVHEAEDSVLPETSEAEFLESVSQIGWTNKSRFALYKATKNLPIK